MKSTWNKTTAKAIEIAKTVTGPIVRAVTSQVKHTCDPTGWSCDCARRREINAASSRTPGRWIEKRKGWLK